MGTAETDQTKKLQETATTGAQMSDLMHFYTAIVRPVLEYASPVWHSSLTVAQTEMLVTSEAGLADYVR